MKSLMMSCKEIVKNISSDERPTWRRKVEIRLHLMMCHHCGKYAKHLELLKKGFKKLFVSKQTQDQTHEIAQLEERIVQKIKK